MILNSKTMKQPNIIPILTRTKNINLYSNSGNDDEHDGVCRDT